MRDRLLTAFLTLLSASTAAHANDRPARAFARADFCAEAVKPAAISVLTETDTYRVLAIKRVESGEVEIHDRWTDIFFVAVGEARLLTGGTAAGHREVGPGEHRGGTLSGGLSHTLKEGDVAHVPAGVPHQLLISPGQQLCYVVVKTVSSRADR